MDPITQQVVLATAGAAGAGDPTYVDDVFSTTLYTSNASSTGDGATQVITTGIDHTEGFLTWIKNRDTTTDHVLFDSERVGSVYKWLYSNDTNAEQDTADIFKSPTSTGFTVKMDTSGSGVGRTNPAGSEEMVSWTFRKCPGFFDVVTYTGASGNQTISHNLGSEPGMILVKNLSDSYEWSVYHRSLGNGKRLRLNTDQDEETSSNYWPSAPTSTTFTVGTDGSNGFPNNNYVAYLFAHDDQSFGTDSDEAIIKCGTYTGNGQVSGTAVDLGFEAQWVMVKGSSGTASSNWVMQNAMTGMSFNSSGNGETVGNAVSANTDGAESGFSPNIIVTPTGFKALNNSNYTNGSGITYVYMAIRRPHKPPTAGTDVFAIDNQGTGTMPPQYHSNFVVDWALTVAFGESQAYRDRQAYTRLLGKKMKKINESGAESNFSSAQWDYMNGWYNNNSSVSTTYSWMFRRAPGFFDVVGYSGTGLARTVSHNLGAVPSVVLITSRNGTFGWYWQHYALGKDTFMQLNNSEGAGSNGGVFDSTLPTSSVFSLPGGDLGGSNGSSYNYVAYLFADLDGISKAGTYTGTGNNINVDCGFSAGARFVIIKKKGTSTSDTGDWYVWDSTRGIVSGNDPYFLMNTDDAEVTGTDYIDPLNAGFTVTSSAPAALNTSGGTYLFLAIA